MSNNVFVTWSTETECLRLKNCISVLENTYLFFEKEIVFEA